MTWRQPPLSPPRMLLSIDRISGPRHRLDLTLSDAGDAAARDLPHGLVGQSFSSTQERIGARATSTAPAPHSSATPGRSPFELNAHLSAPIRARSGRATVPELGATCPPPHCTGKVDLYPDGGEFTTAAMAEGAIDGEAHMYEAAGPHRTEFVFSRFDAAEACPVHHRPPPPAAARRTQLLPPQLSRALRAAGRRLRASACRGPIRRLQHR